MGVCVCVIGHFMSGYVLSGVVYFVTVVQSVAIINYNTHALKLLDIFYCN